LGGIVSGGKPEKQDTAQSHRSTHLDQLKDELHEICQPLTALFCRLEIEIQRNQETPHAEALREMRTETERIRQIVMQMSKTLLGVQTGMQPCLPETERDL
jgi:signal transduction histidine kinase